MATPTQHRILAAAAAVGVYILSGCVLAEVHFTASPIPPWVTLDVKGLDDSKPPTVIVATHATEPSQSVGTRPAEGAVADHP